MFKERCILSYIQYKILASITYLNLEVTHLSVAKSAQKTRKLIVYNLMLANAPSCTITHAMSYTNRGYIIIIISVISVTSQT